MDKSKDNLLNAEECITMLSVNANANVSRGECKVCP
jgi:flagellar biosynthesis/type III secretory pathway protein FliH